MGLTILTCKTETVILLYRVLGWEDGAHLAFPPVPGPGIHGSVWYQKAKQKGNHSLPGDMQNVQDAF